MKYTEEQIENILRIYPSIEEMERQTELRELHSYLDQTDYVACKIAEANYFGKPIEEKYIQILQKRDEVRRRINELFTQEKNNQ